MSTLGANPIIPGGGRDHQATGAGGMPAPVVGIRQRRACRKADADDALFFRTNSGRRFRVRPSIPSEMPSWSPVCHHSWNLVIVARDGLTLERRGIQASAKGVPDEDEFLSILWAHIRGQERNGASGDWDIPVPAHLLMLAAAGAAKDMP